MNVVHYESYQEKDKMLLKVLDDSGNITDIEATKKEVHEKQMSKLIIDSIKLMK